LEIVSGDAIQLHLNPAQEVVMLEGDRDFTGILDNIEKIVKEIDKPVIIKEVGFGVSKDVALRLYNIGVRNIDISGFGGTNFIEIENIRYNNIDFSDLYSWGIPTALALIKCRELPDDLNLIASGGIRNSIDIVKSLVIGGNIAGISGELLSYLLHGGYGNAKDYLQGLIYKIKVLMLLLGKQNIRELKTTEYKVIGDLKDLI
jgi:isopentenyl-diphosphate delta-isomerase